MRAMSRAERSPLIIAQQEGMHATGDRLHFEGSERGTGDRSAAAIRVKHAHAASRPPRPTCGTTQVTTFSSRE
jgi:hypothetical protein